MRPLDEIACEEPLTNDAMANIADYMVSNGHYDDFLEVCHYLYWYVANNGHNLINAVETKFLNFMCVKARDE